MTRPTSIAAALAAGKAVLFCPACGDINATLDAKYDASVWVLDHQCRYCGRAFLDSVESKR